MELTRICQDDTAGWLLSQGGDGLLYHDLAAIPLGELHLSMPPMTCYTPTSMCAFMGGVTLNLLVIFVVTQQCMPISIAACETAVAFSVNGIWIIKFR